MLFKNLNKFVEFYFLQKKIIRRAQNRNGR